ncbi:MAG: HDIG domain-containing protein [Planctomycetaceae bacterium]|nr:HDIG domain-containing protein [Planctomycetaceae bacterium]
MNRDQAVALFKHYNEGPSLYRHALAVEAVMRHFAAKANEDVDYWGVVGLLHDIDYEKYPDEHCARAPEILRAAGCDEAFIRAVVSHGFSICTDVEPQLHMEKVLYATDELTGLVAAAALMLPTKSVADLKLSSLKKKWKDKKFAAGVSREVIADGCERLGMSLDDLMTATMEGMRRAAAE